MTTEAVVVAPVLVGPSSECSVRSCSDRQQQKTLGKRPWAQHHQCQWAACWCLQCAEVAVSLMTVLLVLVLGTAGSLTITVVTEAAAAALMVEAAGGAVLGSAVVVAVVVVS